MQTAVKRIPTSQVSTVQEYVGWVYNATLSGISFIRKDGYWLSVVKADFRTGPKVAFTEGRSLLECMENTDKAARGSYLRWKEHKPWPGKK